MGSWFEPPPAGPLLCIVESWCYEPARETNIGLTNQIVLAIRGLNWLVEYLLSRVLLWYLLLPQSPKRDASGFCFTIPKHKSLFFSVWRGWRTKINFQRIQEAVKVIQRNTKRYFALKRLQVCNVKLKSDTSAEDDSETFPEHNPELRKNAPLNYAPSSLLRSFSTIRQFGFLSAEGSWFDPLETKPDQFTLQSYTAAPCARKMALELNRRHISPLAMLMYNFSPAQPRAEYADKLSSTMLSVNKSSAIVSRRDIEKVTCLCESLYFQAKQWLRFCTESIPSVHLWKIGLGRWKVS